jgi:hypothetical protein
MSALTVLKRPGQDGRMRPVPWRGMAWITWRQQRLTLAGVVAVLGALSLYLLITGLSIHNNPDFAYTYRSEFSLTGPLFQVIPALIGAFVGAPVLARELETGTIRFTWTQGFGRVRWTAATLAPLAIAITVLAGMVGFLYRWCYVPLFGAPIGPSPMAATAFDLQGVALAAWTLTAFSIGVLAGLLIRRVVPAMFATLAAWSGLAVTTAVYLRPHYIAPLVTHRPNLPSTAWVMSQQWTQGGKPVSPATVNLILQKIGAGIVMPGQVGPAPAAGTNSVPAGSTPGNTSITQYLLHHGVTFWASYQPTSRFWPFQWIEGGWLLALSLLLMTAAVWLVRRRAA